jgi:GNAT superfamily N-acetyltransferase
VALSIRRLCEADIPDLSEINPTFTADAELALSREQSGLQAISWVLTERQLPVPFDRGTRYDLREDELCAIRERLRAGDCLQLVADADGRTMGLLEVQPIDWRAVGWVWNLFIDRECRGHGLGRRFIERATVWARESGLKALVAETQANNIHACRFYAHVGFVAGGIDDHYYRYCNDPQAAQEVAVFWYLEV